MTCAGSYQRSILTMRKKVDFSKEYILSRTTIKDNGCWDWTKTKDSKGYGHVHKSSKDAGRRTFKSHRIAWVQWNGEIPNNMLVLHKCDNPACCNPDHLFLGTYQDNYDDCRNKGRVRTGINHQYAKLNVEKIVEILSSDETSTKLGPIYGLHPRGIRRIRDGESYPNELAFIVSEVMFKTGWLPEEIADK